MVHAYRSTAVEFAKEPIPDKLQSDLGVKEIVSAVRTNYSLAIATQNYEKFCKEHDLCFGD
jgi:hypothetical protein